MRKPPKELPEKYYLDHFNEFVDFIIQQCTHLLDDKHQKFVKSYQQLGHDTQCMFVRVVNRQGRFITLNKMTYQEINDCPSQLLALERGNILVKLSSDHIKAWLQQLTKIQLLEILEQYAVSGVKKSASKQVLLDQVIYSCTNTQCLSSDLAQQFRVKNFESRLAYLLFLFFGDTSSGLDKFSMRDLGVLKTRKNSPKPTARFDNLEQAQSVFYYSYKLGQLNCNDLDIQKYALSNLSTLKHPEPAINCAQSKQLKDEFFYLLGKQLLPEYPLLAMEYLCASTHHKAQEKWLRELYKLGEKDRVKTELENIIDNSLDCLLYTSDAADE